MHQMKNSNNSKAIFISECLFAKIWRIILLGCQAFEPIKLLDFDSFFSGITDIEAITVNWLSLIFSQRTLKKLEF